MTENTAKFAGGSYVQHKLQDVYHPKAVDNRAPEDVIADIVAKAGIKII